MWREWLAATRLKLRALMNRRKLDGDLEEELSFHLEMREQKNRAAGTGNAESRAAARRKFGNATLLKERCREMWTFAPLETLWRDARYALRQLRRGPGFTIVAILTLALGIGANTAIFSLLDPLLVRKLPVRDPDALVFLGNGGVPQSQDYDTAVISELQAYRHYRDENRVFSGVLAFTTSEPYDVELGGQPSSASGEVVSANYFTVLGLRPYLGRFFTAQDGGASSAAPLAVLSYSYWRRAFRSNPAVIGQAISIQNSGWSYHPLVNHLFTIAGVAPPGFFGTEVGRESDLYLPAPNQGDSPPWVVVLARLKPGISLEHARVALAPIYQETVRDSTLPPIEKKQDMTGLVIEPAAHGLSPVRNKFQLAAEISMAVVALVLLIACVNVSSLLLARGISRRRELTIRAALGSGRWPLVRQILVEAALLGCAGAIAGVLAAAWAAKSLAAALSTKELPVHLDASIGAPILAFSAAVLIVTILLSGLIPALLSTRGNLAADLKVAGPNATSAPSRSTTGSILLAAQIAISAVVLAATGLLLHSLFNLETHNLGFDADHLLVITLTGQPSSPAFYEQLLDRAKHLPGARAAAYSALTPLTGDGIGINVSVEGHPAESPAQAHVFFNEVSPGYLETMGIPLLEGRAFTPRDGASQPPRFAIINRTMAQHYFGQRNPVGQTFKFVEGNRPPMQIVGVAADSAFLGVRQKPTDFIYLPYARATRFRTFDVRVSGSPAALAPAVRDLVHSLDRSVTIENLTTMRHQLNESLHQDRLIGTLCAACALLALALTCVGIYGVLSFQVVQRTNEIGIRIAFGAQRRHILSLILSRGAAILAAGLAVGIAGALVATRVIAHMLFGVSADDPATFVGVAALLAAVAFAACWIPARRASRLDPLAALRHE